MTQKRIVLVLAVGLIVLGLALTVAFVRYSEYQHAPTDERPLQVNAIPTTCSYEVPHVLEAAVTANHISVGETTILKTSTAGLGEPYYIVIVKTPEMSLGEARSTTPSIISDPESSDVLLHFYAASDILQFARIRDDLGIELMAIKPGNADVLLGVNGEAMGTCGSMPWYSWVAVYSEPILITVE